MLTAPTAIQPWVSDEDQYPMEYVTMKASAAVNNGEALKQTSSASTFERAATNSTFTHVYAGADRASSLTDTPKKPAYIVRKGGRFIFPVGDGGGTSMTRGDLVDFDGGSYSAIDLAASTNDDVIFIETYTTDSSGNITSFIGEFNV